MTHHALFVDIEKRLRLQAEDALAYMAFADIGNQSDIVESVNRSEIGSTAKVVRVGIIQSLALCASRMCDRGKDTYSLFRMQTLLADNALKSLVVKDALSFMKFESTMQVLDVDPDTQRLKDFRNYALAHMIPGKYAAVTGTDYETLFRVSKRAVECVFALTAATGSVAVGIDAVYDTWHGYHLDYWNRLLGSNT